MSRLGPFAEMKPEDGFHVNTVPLGDPPTKQILTFFVLHKGGCVPDLPDDVINILELDHPTPRDTGSCLRLEHVLAAVARYFTTGGTWPELERALSQIRRVILPGFVADFPGYYLYETALTVDHTYEHTFVRDDDSGEAVLWQEYLSPAVPGFIVATTLEQIRREREALAAVGQAASGTTVAALLGPQDPAHP